VLFLKGHDTLLQATSKKPLHPGPVDAKGGSICDFARPTAALCFCTMHLFEAPAAMDGANARATLDEIMMALEGAHMCFMISAEEIMMQRQFEAALRGNAKAMS
jgi:hypothetical protein